MQLDDRLSAEIIKIFHNSKGSVQNNIVKWTNHTSDKQIEEKTTWEAYSEKKASPRATSHFEHRLQQKKYTRPNEFEENTVFETTSTLQKSEITHRTKDIIED